MVNFVWNRYFLNPKLATYKLLGLWQLQRETSNIFWESKTCIMSIQQQMPQHNAHNVRVMWWSCPDGDAGVSFDEAGWQWIGYSWDIKPYGKWLTMLSFHQWYCWEGERLAKKCMSPISRAGRNGNGGGGGGGGLFMSMCVCVCVGLIT